MEEISQEWQDTTPRRMLFSGLGGAGKTELSVSVIDKLRPDGYVLWLRASDHKVLEQDLISVAEELRHELLRFDAGNDPTTGEARVGGAFYFSPVNQMELLAIFKRWLKQIPNRDQRILLLLDDLDGLDPAEHEKYSLMFAGDAIDLIYTARDPSMADPSMIWQAINIDVPPLQMDQAVDLLGQFSRDNRPTRRKLTRESSQVVPTVHGGHEEKAQMRDIATCLGALPAALAMGSHYMKDNLASKWNADGYKEFLDLWTQDDGKRHVLQSHRAMLKYRHSIIASFEVSLQRMRRNIVLQASHDALTDYCLKLLQLFSAMDVEEISRDDLARLKIILHTAPPPLLDLPIMLGTMSIKPLERSLSELTKVSLLTERSTDGTLLLNNVIKVCALLVPNSISLEDKSVVEESAQEVLRRWKLKGPGSADSLDEIFDDSSSLAASAYQGQGTPEVSRGKKVIRELGSTPGAKAKESSF